MFQIVANLQIIKVLYLSLIKTQKIINYELAWLLYGLLTASHTEHKLGLTFRVLQPCTDILSGKWRDPTEEEEEENDEDLDDTAADAGLVFTGNVQ